MNTMTSPTQPSDAAVRRVVNAMRLERDRSGSSWESTARAAISAAYPWIIADHSQMRDLLNQLYSRAEAAERERDHYKARANEAQESAQFWIGEHNRMERQHNALRRTSEGKPSFWWNGTRKVDDGHAPSFREEENTWHDIPLFAGWNPQSDVAQKLTVAESEVARLTAELATYRPFWEKYALGPKASPSCLVCGSAAVPWPPAIQHAEIPGIVVCHSCAMARAELAQRDEAVARNEREACAQVCNAMVDLPLSEIPAATAFGRLYEAGVRHGLVAATNAIRARAAIDSAAEGKAK